MIQTTYHKHTLHNYIIIKLPLAISYYKLQLFTPMAAVWHSGSVLVSINEVNLRRARLVLGWVTVAGFNSRCGTSISVYNHHPGQLSLAIPLWVDTFQYHHYTQPTSMGLYLILTLSYQKH